MNKKGDRRECTKYWGVCLDPWKCVWQFPEKRYCKTIEPELEDTQCLHHPGRSTVHQLLLSSKFSRNLWSMPKMSTHVLLTSRRHKGRFTIGNPCEKTRFFEKSFGEWCKYCADDRLLPAAKSLYSSSDVCVRVGGVASQLFTEAFKLRQRCVMSPFLFIVYVN